MSSEAGQLSIDFDYDERTVRLASEFAVMLALHLAPGTKKDAAQAIAARLAVLAGKRYSEFGEPVEPIRCHTCDEMTIPKTRVRVVVCLRCSCEGRSVGSTG